MKIFLLFYQSSEYQGSREEWSVMYTDVEAFSTDQLRKDREWQLKELDDSLDFEYGEADLDQPLTSNED